jgi:uncharacterized protein YPO0396
LQKIHVIEPHVSAVGFVHNEDGRRSLLRNMSIQEYREEKQARDLAAVNGRKRRQDETLDDAR